MVQKPALGKALATSLLDLSGESTTSENRQDEFLATIRGKSNNWIQQKPLLEVAFRFIALHHIDPSTLTGKLLAQLTQRLTQDEVAPGGPYNATSYDTYLTNLAVQKLLKLLDISLEALGAYLAESAPHELSDFEKQVLSVLRSEVPRYDKVSSRGNKKFADDVVKQTQLYLLGIDSHIDTLMDRMIQKVKQVDITGEVSCLAHDFCQSLAKKPRRLTRQILVEIGVANYCAWIAYAIYDDFIDDEGKPELLPIANIAHRYSIVKYQEVAKALGISSRNIIRSFNSVDTGSVVEIRKFKATLINSSAIEIPSLHRYTNYDFLSERALGFLAGPLLILEMLDGIDNSKKTLMKKGLSAYIQARQISDDLTDWRSDLYSGRLSSVVTTALMDAQIRPSTYDIQHLDKVLSAQLWKSTFVGTTHTIRGKVEQAESLIKSSAIFDKDAFFYDHYIEPLAIAAINLENDHLLKSHFLKAYRKPFSVRDL